MVRVFRTSLVILVHILVNFSVKSQDYYYNQNTENYYNYPTIPTITEYQGGTIVDYVYTFTKSKSPYIVRNDIIIEENAEVRIEPGVDIQFEPQIGITVRGVLTILGTEQERVTLTSARDPIPPTDSFPDIRLVDGPSILAGRVQIRHNGIWRSVCTNSKNWTQADMEIACRQLGFQGGSFYNWFNREMPLKPRLLYEEPKCNGQESTLLHCDWVSRQLGAGVCDYHPDLAIQCLPAHERSIPFWRGIRFENAKSSKILTLDNTLYVPTSRSRLINVNIKYAGRGRNQNTTSALEVIGIPPVINNLDVLDSAYNGVNITNPDGPIFIDNCRLSGNRGHGIFVNSSYGMAQINNCIISGNGGDGIQYVHNEERPNEKVDRTDISDFCTLATADSQTYPITIYASQLYSYSTVKRCSKVFKTKYGHKLTLQFLRAETERNNSAVIEVYDGSSYSNRLIVSFPIRNNTRPQSIISTTNQIYVNFVAEPYTNMFIYMKLSSGLTKTYNLNVSNSDISENEGRGIAFENLRTQLYVSNTTISKNSHVAGIHVTSGVGDVNVTHSRISFNEGDGINITYTGGARNISRSFISSNRGYGVAIWLNNTKETEYIMANQTTAIEYSEIIKNLDIGVLHGNYCANSNINITGNLFEQNINDALEILTCWRDTNDSTKLQIGHNNFIANNKIALRIYPALNLEAKIEFNYFKNGHYGALLVRNKLLEEFNVLKTNLLIHQNYFIQNKGVFVVNLGLSPYSEKQYLLFTRNFVKDNEITEPFLPEDGSVSKLNPRSRVSAPIVIASNNVDIYRNIIENPKSKYELGSQLSDQSKIINCTYNYLGSTEEEKIFQKIFHRNDRYNLAQIAYIPFLLHNSNPLTNRLNLHSYYVPRFNAPNRNVVGGEIEGEEYLQQGEYIVEKDINIRPGGKLVVEPGVTLLFPPSIGVMVGGRLEARGRSPDSIKFTLKQEITHPPDNETYETDTENYNGEQTEIVEIEPLVPIRLLGGKTTYEGRLQIKIENKWGTVCNYGWDIIDAALVCHQLGLTLNPDDWNLERNQIPAAAGVTEPVILSNVNCDDYDIDITKCKSEKFIDFENSCTHDNDVGLRCYDTSWAGLRFGGLSERSDIQFITIEKSGLLDYSTNSFKPALQLDFARHNFQNIKVTNNFHDGLGVTYSDIYKEDTVNVVKNSEFTYNKGAGISFKQLGLNLFGNVIEHNYIGIKHDPVISGLQQRELSGWFHVDDNILSYKPFKIPHDTDINEFRLEKGETKYIVTTKVSPIGEPIQRSYKFKTEPGYVIGIQLLNPVENRSTEVLWIHDSITNNNKSALWSLNRDLTIFPTTSSSHGIIINYHSGVDPIGGVVIILSTIQAPIQSIYNRIVKGPIPTLTVRDTKIRSNVFGVHASYYNRYLNELGDHFLRKANDSIRFISSEISHNENEAIFIHSPHWDLHKSNLSEITFMINNSLITDNGRGIYQFSRDMRASNNLFHYIFQDDTIERNHGGGFEINLPYVWQYNENFTHSVYMNNVTWRLNNNFGVTVDGHFALINITRTLFSDNNCKTGLISLQGMEKKMLIDYNRIERNNGQFIIDFGLNSQSEIIGVVPAKFIYNEFRNNKFSSYTRGGFGTFQMSSEPTTVVRFKGIQKVKFNRNIFSDNSLDYLLIAGIKTAKMNNYLDVTENWWGTTLDNEISKRIFDFDDWNDHAIAQFRPYLTQDNVLASLSTSFTHEPDIDYDNLGGRLSKNVVLVPRDSPYIIKSDLTVMPKVTLTIYPGVVMEFAPNVGILVLGTLKAEGIKDNEIIMRPIIKNAEMTYGHDRGKRQLEQFSLQDSIRLCQGKDCTDKEITNEGFLEYFNKTTLQWIPMCDPRFTERNAQVVCRELGFDPINAYFDRDIRIEYHSNSLTRIWSWPEPLQCTGTETKYENCPIRLNGQQFGHRYECKWNSKFIFIHCGKRNLRREWNYWGGLRFTDSEFEQQLYNNRIHNPETHDVYHQEESILRFVHLIGAGLLHNEKSAAVQTITKSPKIQNVIIKNAASHGVNLISPSKTMNLESVHVTNTLGIGINILSLTGEGREGQESSFTPLKSLNLPYNLFGIIDICDTTKEIIIEERILLYYKYDNHPINCVKIFKSAYNAKPFGFRLLQFNLFNSTTKYGIPDFIELYDGDIYNVSSKLIGRITMDSKDEKKMYTTKIPSLSVKLFANGASSDHGFIAEIVTLPISAIVFNRDVQHNITASTISNNKEGGILYMSAGEINPIITIEKNQLKNNCKKFYGNFTTCKAAVELDIQNTQLLFFRNNLVEGNQGGLSIKADSRGSATSLKGYIHNNLFVNNSNYPALYVEGRQSSPYQDVVIYRNYFTRNVAQYANNIVLRQVVSNFTYNYVKNNVGLQNLEVSGFDKVRLPIYQTTTHNGFYMNYAVHIHSRSTIVAGTAGQHYVDNIFFNPDNDYEMITVNKSLFDFNSTLELWKTKIDAAYNYWGFNTTLAVSGRIRDQSDDPRLLEVNYNPYYKNNASILNGKCPPGWELVGDTCYFYVGAPMAFNEARSFCHADNASMPYLIGQHNYPPLNNFIRKQEQGYLYTGRVWVQHIDMINSCTQFIFDSIETGDCEEKLPFICEIDPKVYINPLAWHGDLLTIIIITCIIVAIILIGCVAGCWWSKSKYRQAQRLERRNSIRQSLHSLKSVGSTNGFSDYSYRRKPGQLSSRSTDTLTKNSDYKKMVSNSSIDSMEKSYNSSIDDNQSYDVYEANNPTPSGFSYNTTMQSMKKSLPTYDNHYAQPFNLAYRNEGFKDNSTFASNSNYQSRAESNENTMITDETPIITPGNVQNLMSYPPSEYFTTDTLPLSEKSSSTITDQQSDKYNGNNFLKELKQKLPSVNNGNLPTPPPIPKIKPSQQENNFGYPHYQRQISSPEEYQYSNDHKILETNFDEPISKPKTRSKSEALLETNFDCIEPMPIGLPISEASRSKSQPLETAM